MARRRTRYPRKWRGAPRGFVVGGLGENAGWRWSGRIFDDLPLRSPSWVMATTQPFGTVPGLSRRKFTSSADARIEIDSCRDKTVRMSSLHYLTPQTASGSAWQPNVPRMAHRSTRQWHKGCPFRIDDGKLRLRESVQHSGESRSACLLRTPSTLTTWQRCRFLNGGDGDILVAGDLSKDGSTFCTGA